MTKKNQSVKNGIMCTTQFVNKKLLPKKKGPLTRAQAEKAVTKCHDPNCKMTEKDHELFYLAEIRTMMGKDGMSTMMDLTDMMDYFSHPDEFYAHKITTDRFGNKTRHMIRKDQDCLSCGLKKGRPNTLHYVKGHKKDMKPGFLCRKCQNELREEYEHGIIESAGR